MIENNVLESHPVIIKRLNEAGFNTETADDLVQLLTDGKRIERNKCYLVYSDLIPGNTANNGKQQLFTIGYVVYLAKQNFIKGRKSSASTSDVGEDIFKVIRALQGFNPAKQTENGTVPMFRRALTLVPAPAAQYRQQGDYTFYPLHFQADIVININT